MVSEGSTHDSLTLSFWLWIKAVDSKFVNQENSLPCVKQEAENKTGPPDQVQPQSTFSR